MFLFVQQHPTSPQLPKNQLELLEYWKSMVMIHKLTLGDVKWLITTENDGPLTQTTSFHGFGCFQYPYKRKCPLTRL